MAVAGYEEPLTLLLLAGDLAVYAGNVDGGPAAVSNELVGFLLPVEAIYRAREPLLLPSELAQLGIQVSDLGAYLRDPAHVGEPDDRGLIQVAVRASGAMAGLGPARGSLPPPLPARGRPAAHGVSSPARAPVPGPGAER